MREVPTYKWTEKGMQRTDIPDQWGYLDYTYVRVEDVPALNPPLLPPVVIEGIKWHDIRSHHHTPEKEWKEYKEQASLGIAKFVAALENMERLWKERK